MSIHSTIDPLISYEFTILDIARDNNMSIVERLRPMEDEYNRLHLQLEIDELSKHNKLQTMKDKIYAEMLKKHLPSFLWRKKEEVINEIRKIRL